MADLRVYSKELISDIIAIYKNHSCLWKVKSSENLDRVAKEKAWTELIESFNEVGKGVTHDVVIKKMKSLKTSWRKEAKKVRSSIKSGAGEDEVYQAKLWYFYQLRFIEDQELPRDSTSTMEETEDVQDDGEVVCGGSSEINTLSHDDDLTSSPIPLSPATPSSTGSSNSCDRGRSIARYRMGKRNERDEVVEIIKRRFGQPEEKLTMYDYLARNWAEKLKTLKNDEQQIVAEKLINDVLFEAELGRLTTTSYIERHHFLSASQFPTPSVPPFSDPFTQIPPTPFSNQTPPTSVEPSRHTFTGNY